LSKQIEKAQKKVEDQHFLARKHTLDYDDVLNQQREVIYTYRDEVLEGRDMSGPAREEIAALIRRLVEEYTEGDFVEDWDIDGLIARVNEVFIPSDDVANLEAHRVDREELIDQLLVEAGDWYDRREAELGEELMRGLERFLLLQVIDQRWREHLHDMDYLQHGIHLRGAAQVDPLVAYKNEAYTLFGELMHTIWEDFARMIFHAQVVIGPNGEAPPLGGPAREAPASSSSTAAGRLSYSGGSGAVGASAIAAAAAMAGAAPVDPGAYEGEAGEGAVAVEQRHVDPDEPGRNDPCWCGSGKKFKKCHGA
jgi:preprotein translocase subunit SecA